MNQRFIFILFAACLAASALTAGDKMNFSGDWAFSETKSTLDEMGTRFIPTVMKLTQQDNDLVIQRTYQREYEDDFVLEESVTLDGEECHSEFWNSPRVSTANWSEKGDTLIIDTKITFEREGQTSEMNIREAWSLKEEGKMLTIEHFSSSDWGEREIIMVFDKKEAQPE